MDGFQWVNGSFVEDVEANKDRPPNDIDLVTFASRPMEIEDNAQWETLMSLHTDIFVPEKAKQSYLCDAYFIDLNTPPWFLVKQTRYWFGLFSHQRETYTWKGMIELSMNDDEKASGTFLSNGEIHVP